MECCRRGHHNILPWSFFEAIGQDAIHAVVRAGWSFKELKKLAHSFREREVSRSSTENALIVMASNAKRRKFG